jgi:succinate-acetate transporter protein
VRDDIALFSFGLYWLRLFSALVVLWVSASVGNEAATAANDEAIPGALQNAFMSA